MKRFWVSWISGYYGDEGCTTPPFQVWISGQMCRRPHLPQAFESGNEKDDCIICAVIDAEKEEDIWPVVANHFPDYEQRFCEEREPDYVPGGRTYLIDFKILDDTGFWYLEVKGYTKPTDLLKWNAVRSKGFRLEVWFDEDIKKRE